MIRLRTFFFVLFFSKIMASPFKTRYEAIGYMFGKPLESFDHLLPVKKLVDSRPNSPQPSTSRSPDNKPSSLMEAALDMDKILPTDLDSPTPQPSTSRSPDNKPSSLMEVALDMDKILPTDLDIVCNWIFECDRTRTSKDFPEANSVIYKVADNLIQFWKENTAIELR